jgi:hypothetical protein
MPCSARTSYSAAHTELLLSYMHAVQTLNLAEEPFQLRRDLPRALTLDIVLSNTAPQTRYSHSAESTQRVGRSDYSENLFCSDAAVQKARCAAAASAAEAAAAAAVAAKREAAAAQRDRAAARRRSAAHAKDTQQVRRCRL